MVRGKLSPNGRSIERLSSYREVLSQAIAQQTGGVLQEHIILWTRVILVTSILDFPLHYATCFFVFVFFFHM